MEGPGTGRCVPQGQWRSWPLQTFPDTCAPPSTLPPLRLGGKPMRKGQGTGWKDLHSTWDTEVGGKLRD